jgi:mersacidin/lichenicidin family type 2 lantibiotic
MPYQNIVRVWKDPTYRLSLTAAERAQLPDNPAGTIELTEAELNMALGGTGLAATDTCGFTGNFICPDQP